MPAAHVRIPRSAAGDGNQGNRVAPYERFWHDQWIIVLVPFQPEFDPDIVPLAILLCNASGAFGWPGWVPAVDRHPLWRSPPRPRAVLHQGSSPAVFRLFQSFFVLFLRLIIFRVYIKI